MRSVTVYPDTLATDDLEGHRRELTAYCYRMLGSGFDAEDAVQETLVRAWRAGEDFEGRSSVRSWLYRIATNVCLDMIRGRQRRARPMELGPSRPPVESSLEAVLPDPVGAQQRALLDRYVDAFQRYDIDSLVKLLQEDADQSMPPFAMWLCGADDIGRFMLGPGALCRGSWLIPQAANGSPAYAQFKPDPKGGYMPWALQVLEISGDRIAGIHSFLDTERLFPAFGLPSHLPAGWTPESAGFTDELPPRASS